GNRPLRLAAREGHVEVLERLLAAKATVDAEQKSGERPLHWAAWSGHRHVVERLLAAGAVVEAQDKKCGCRPLHWAAFEGHLPVWRDSLRRRPRSKPRTTEARAHLTWPRRGTSGR
ncbi:unnamed protein product, partial [Durusdinium trenchii]